MAANLLFNPMKRSEFPEEGNRIVLPVELVLRRSLGCKTRHSRPAGFQRRSNEAVFCLNRFLDEVNRLFAGILGIVDRHLDGLIRPFIDILACIHRRMI